MIADVERIKREIEKLSASGRLDNKIVYILGANEEAALMIKALGANSVCAVLDVRKQLNGRMIYGKPIQFIEEALVPYSKEKIVLLTNGFRQREIDKLNMLGYLHNEQRFWICEPYVYKPRRENRFFQRIKRLGLYKLIKSYVGILKAEKVIRTLYESGKNHIFFSPYPSVGDIYILGEYLNEGKIPYDSSSTIITCGNACKKMAESCGFQNVISAPAEIINQISKLKCIVGKCLGSLESLHYDYFPPVSCMLPTVYRYGVTFDELFVRLKFGTTYNLSNKILDPEKTKLESYCRKNGIEQGKSVIIAPYAKSAPEISLVFWEELVCRLKKKGYKVFMNQGSASELCIHDATPICPPLEYLSGVIEYAGAIVSIRSGICDICSCTNAKKIVIYPKQIEKYGEKYIEHIGFSNFSYIPNLFELECESIPSCQFTERVIKLLDN